MHLPTVARRSPFLVLLLLGCSSKESPPKPPVLDAAGRVPALRCPGGPGCESGVGPLLAGVAKRDITPAVESFEDLDGDAHYDEGEPFTDLNGNGAFDPVWMAGFGRGREARGVHDPQWLRVLTLRQGDLHLALVALDAVGIFHGSVIRLRQQAEEAGLDFDHIVLAATHDHEAKDTTGLWGQTVTQSGWDEAFMTHLFAEGVAALREASQGEREVVVRAAQADAADLIADSRLPKVVDGQITALTLAEPGGDVRAVLALWGNHAETLSNHNRLLSSDYPHSLRVRLEEAYPGAQALFVPSTLGGMMSPLGLVPCADAEGRPRCDNASFEKAEWVGRTAAERALAALEGAEAIDDSAPVLAFERESTLLGLSNLVFAIAFDLGVFERQLFAPDGHALSPREVEALGVRDVQAGNVRFQTEVGWIRLGPVELLTIPGELYPELWLERPDGTSFVEHPENADYPAAPVEPPLRGFLDRSRLHTTINQANDTLGYVLPKAQYDLESPRAYLPEGQYGEENSLGPDAASGLVEAFAAMRSR